MHVDLTTGIAIVCAVSGVVATIVSTMTYRHQRGEQRRNIKVMHGLGFITVGPYVEGDDLFIMSGQNVGKVPVTLAGVRLIISNPIDSNRGHLIMPSPSGDHPFPYALLPGQAASYHRSVRQLAFSLRQEGYSGEVRLALEFNDPIGNRFKSAQFPFDVSGWLNSSK